MIVAAAITERASQSMRSTACAHQATPKMLPSNLLLSTLLLSLLLLGSIGAGVS